MMPLLWVALCWLLPPLVLLSGPDGCLLHDSGGSQHESPELRSLRCHNDYKSHVHCSWRTHERTGLQLWFKSKQGSKRCEPYWEEQQHDSGNGTVQCRYNTQSLAIGIKHTVFFLEEKSSCWSSRQTLELSQRLRARTPGDLSTRDPGDGGRHISWSSPYPSSSSLNKDITYQLSYRTHRNDTWMTEEVTNTSIRLEKLLLMAGHTYEARVRARVRVSQWSHWSPVVTWRTELEAGHFPRVHCVLDDEEEVMCSWSVSRETAHFITYQLACRQSRSAPSETCCANLTVTSDPGGMLLKYSCWLTVAEPEHLLLELQPTRYAKTFEANKHIRPNPPQQVEVKKKGNNWWVYWIRPAGASNLDLNYQVCYNRITEQGCSQLQNVSGSMSLTILEACLDPLQRYRVRVRSLIDPGGEGMYGGIPSEWSESVEWTSDAESWSPQTLMYCSIGAFVAVVFLTLYCTVPACQRRVVLWVDSVPSPGKSKIFMEIKSATSHMPSENTLICRVQDMESLSTCSSIASLWPTKDSEEQDEEQDEGCWSCDNPASPTEKVNSSSSSSMSFSGPYIFCQRSGANKTSVDVTNKETEEEKETPPDDSAASSPVNFTLFGDGYVGLPGRNVSRSTQDLVSRSDMYRQGGPDQEQQSPETSQLPDQTDIQPASSQQPPPYTSVAVSCWPQGGAIQASGYCHIPSPQSGPAGFT